MEPDRAGAVRRRSGHFLADPSGPIEAAKESMATVKSATNPSSREQLVTEVALDIQAEVQQKRNPLKGVPPLVGGDRPEW